MSKRYNAEKITPRGHNLQTKKLKGADLENPDHFRKIIACELMSIDNGWRTHNAYGPETTEEYITTYLGADDAEKRIKQATAMQNSAKEGYRSYFVCYENEGTKDERLVGLAAITDWSVFKGYENLGTQLSHMFVLPGYERLGVAGKLIEHCEYEAKQRGIERLYLEATPVSTGLYAKHGYTDAPEGDPHMDTSDKSIVFGKLMYKDISKAKEPQETEISITR